MKKFIKLVSYTSFIVIVILLIVATINTIKTNRVIEESISGLRQRNDTIGLTELSYEKTYYRQIRLA